MRCKVFKGRLAVLTLAMLVMAATSANGEVLFRDNFNGSMSTEWSIIRDDPAYYSVESTYLDLRANSGELGDTWANNAKNLFLIDTPTTGDFVITMRVDEFIPVSLHAAQVDILAYDDDDNLVRCIYGYVYGRRVLESATTGRAGGMRKAPKRGRGRESMW